MAKKEDVKSSVKAAEAKVAETKETITAKANEVKAAVKEETEKVSKEAAKTVEKAAKKASAAGKAVKKTAAKVVAPTTKMTLQYQGRDVEISQIEERIKAKFVEEGHRAGNIKTLDIYLKPEEYKAWYVINDGKFDGCIDLF